MLSLTGVPAFSWSLALKLILTYSNTFFSRLISVTVPSDYSSFLTPKPPWDPAVNQVAVDHYLYLDEMYCIRLIPAPKSKIIDNAHSDYLKMLPF